MASKEELNAMGISAKQCKECCRDISEQEYNSHKGYCKSCYNDIYNIESKKRNFNSGKNEVNTENDDTTNTIANVIKTLAILNVIVGVILGLVGLEDFEGYAVLFIGASIISSIFIYAIGEIIQLLEDIKNK